MNAVAVEKFKSFEWLTHGITASSPSFERVVHGTGEKPLNFEDRLGAIAAMETQLAKSVTSLIVFGHSSKSDYEFVRNHLATIMLKNAKHDKKREPEGIAMYHLAWLVAKMVLDFALDPELEENYTAKGRLAYAGMTSTQMPVNAYRQTWKPYENLMILSIESAIKEASKTVDLYRKQTFKDCEKNS